MTCERCLRLLILATALGGCGAGQYAPSSARAQRDARNVVPVHAAAGAGRTGHPIALVTAEAENRIVAVDLRTGRILRYVSLPADPENVVSSSGAVVVVSTTAGAVTLLDRDGQRLIGEVRGLRSPHIPSISPRGTYAYVTDDVRGTVTAIRLRDRVVADRVAVGDGAHHLAWRPDGREVWVALGETASTIVALDTSNPARPRVLDRFEPGLLAHDLLFSPNGRRVWISSATGPDVTVISSSDRSLLFRVPVGRPPQHIAFDGRYAYLTSGYGRMLEKADAATGRIVAHTRTPFGSFELDAAHGYVAVSSLLRGTLAIYDLRLRLLHMLHIGRAARDVAISP
jgi:DNA-binding beta-propeller fold protein YncE